jgi:hypothetical protein
MQQLQQQAPPSFARPAPTTFDEASMERSRGFVKALQVRPRAAARIREIPPLPDFSSPPPRSACREIRVLRLYYCLAGSPLICSVCCAGAQEPAAAAILRLRVLREVLPPQRAEARVRFLRVLLSHAISSSCTSWFSIDSRSEFPRQQQLVHV